MRQRLDAFLVARKTAPTRSQAESMIRLGDVKINGQVVLRPGHFVGPNDRVVVADKQRYVSRAGLKLASVAEALKLDFGDKIVLDVGSSTGGFTDYALQHGAQKIIAVDVGTDQLHPRLHGHPRIALHEKTDIRDFIPEESIDIIVMDVSFISLREILPHIADISTKHTQIVAMLKPQFEAGRAQVNKGIIKNDSIRRQIVKDFEMWAKNRFVVVDKKDSDVAGSKGNRERFYLLQRIA